MNYLQRLINDRRAVALIAGNLVLVLLTVISFNAMVDARDGAIDRAADVVECQHAAETIESLQNRNPGLPLIATNSAPDMTRRVDLAREDAALMPANIQAISPQPPQRLGNSPYSEVSTQIELIDVPLRQTLSFIAALCPTDGGLRLTAFHLSSHSESSALAQSDIWKWAADLTVASTSAAQMPSSESIKP